MEKIPEATHTTRDRPTLPVFAPTPFGLTNIPDPIILPTMTVTPFNKLILGFKQITSEASAFPSGDVLEDIWMLSFPADLSESAMTKEFY